MYTEVIERQPLAQSITFNLSLSLPDLVNTSISHNFIEIWSNWVQTLFMIE